MLIPIVAVSIVLGLAARARAADLNLTVDLGYAQYKGANVKNNVSQWLGIRYAAAPVGENRFRAPQDPPVNTALQYAEARGPVCHSSPSTSLSLTNKEDCLFLNVFAPTAAGNHPVFVYFQGGGFNSLASPNDDGNSLIVSSDHDIVVVTFNYRVGLYGFLASKEVQADGNANAGLLDQRKVLEWVQKYIHLFGGDPCHVTIGGASAGGASVDLHLTAYEGRDDGLFHAGAAESQSFGVQLTTSEAQYQYDALVKRVSCDTAIDTLKCLRDLPIKTLAENNPNIPTPGGAGGNPVFMWSNTIDGNFTTDWSYNLFSQGKFVKVPVIFGDDTNEGTIFTPTSIANVTQMTDFLRDNWPKLTPTQLTMIESMYPATSENYFPPAAEYWRPAADAYGEIRYNCPGLYISGAFSRVGGLSASWNYHWDVLSLINAANGDGVTHTAESSSIWGSDSSTQVEYPLQSMIQSYWTSFIRSKNPNTYKLSTAPEWEKYFSAYEEDNSTGAQQRIHFTNNVTNVAMETVDHAQQERCGFLHSIGSIIGQ